MSKAVILETDTIINQTTRDYLTQNQINIINVAAIEQYNGDADFVLEYSSDTTEKDIDTLIKRSKGLPVHIGNTSRLGIREIYVEDIPSLINIYNSCPTAFSADFGLLDELFLNYIKENGAKDCPISLIKKQNDLITQYQKYQYSFYNYGLWLLFSKENQEEIVGIAGLYDSAPVKISYIILPKYQNMGLCSEALDFINNYAKNELHINKIYATIDKSNLPSLHLAAKFKYTLI